MLLCLLLHCLITTSNVNVLVLFICGDGQLLLIGLQLAGDVQLSLWLIGIIYNQVDSVIIVIAIVINAIC